MPHAVSLSEQLRWVRQQRQWRNHWLAEGLLGGHDREAMARYQRDLTVLEALEASLELLKVRQLMLFDVED